MSRSQDTVIDDDEETCPLCIEEFDLSDKNFRPCPCGYQICQFCFNSLKNTYEKSTCPNCRRPYDEKTIQYKIPTAEEFKLDLLNKNKKQAAAKRKETEKREVENSSRRNLAGVRVKQQNLVYVIGLIPQIKDEQALLQTLRGPDYFGQYGEIEKIVVSKPKPGAVNQGIGVYVTYARKEDAALCINTVDGSQNGDRVLRAQYGTTKYCSAYLRGETCNNKNCSFLHETGEDGQHSSLQNEPHGARLPAKVTPTSQSAQVSAPPRPLSAAQNPTMTQPMARQGSKEDSSSRKNSHDGSALPSTASWANANASVARTRRTSQANSRATPSPQLAHAPLVSHKIDEPKIKESAPQAASTSAPKKTSTPESVPPPPKYSYRPEDIVQQQFDDLVKRIHPNARFVYDDSCLTPEVRAAVDAMPRLIDPYGGLKRRAMREREEKERAKVEADAKAKLEAQATASAEETLDEENMVAGSLALGGEPEDDPRTSSSRGAIGRPSQSIADRLSSLDLDSRSLTPQQRQQLALSDAGDIRPGSGLGQPTTQNTAFEMSDFDRRGPQYSQAQFEQISSHQRHGSRYFSTDSKPTSANRFQGQQQAFYPSGVQGPPPGLPTAGTPPVSGGGMFAHGQNFTNPGFGTSKDANTEIYARNRSGTNQGHDLSKRGGVEHLADPTIVTARVHQGSTTGQGLFGGNQVDDKNFPPLPLRSDSRSSPLHSRVSSYHSLQSAGIRSTTPRIPPGFELTHGHPVPPSRQASPAYTGQATRRGTPGGSATVTPAVPLLPFGPRTSTPKLKQSEAPKDIEEEPSILLRKQRQGASEISLGSPKLRTTRSKAELNKKPDEGKVEGKREETDEPSTPVKSGDVKGKAKATGQKPEKIELPPTITGSTPKAPLDPILPSSEKAKSATPVWDSSVIVGTPGTLSSRPATPAAVTTPSELSKASTIGARPRTLRLTTGTTAKPAEPTPASIGTEKPSAFPPLSATKKGSRRPSLSSAQHSRPSTPAISDHHSHDASRASSPPHSIVGSAPERVKSKNQQKKDRKEKAKRSTEVTEASVSAPTPPAVEEVAPVIARQKKQKKRVESSATASMEDPAKIQEKSEKAGSAPKQDGAPESAAKTKNAAKENPPPAPSKTVEATATPPLPSPKEEQSTRIEDNAGAPYTLRDLYNDAGKLADSTDTSSAVQKLLQEHVSPMPRIISSMIQSGDLSKDHPWLNPPNFNSAAYKLPPDSRRGQDYLDGNGYGANDAFGYIYLPLKEKRALKDGHAVSVADAGERKDDLLRRCLVTPNGWVLRHLTGDESEKVLELGERRQMYFEEFGDVGTMDGLTALEPDDYTNLRGGMERLSRHGERHGVIWVLGESEQMGEEDEFDSFDDEDDEIGGDVGVSDEEEPILGDEGLAEADDAGLDLQQAVNMPGSWDLPPPNLSHGKQSVGRTSTVPGLSSEPKSPTLTLAGKAKALPLSQRTVSTPKVTKDLNVNLRAMETESLQKRVAEKQKELEQSRKEMEKIEKLWNKKSKDIARWREGLAKG